MGEHFTRNTLETTAYCPKCRAFTQHRVDGGRKGPCIAPNHPEPGLTKAQERRRRKAEHHRQNPGLFE